VQGSALHPAPKIRFYLIHIPKLMTALSEVQL